MLAAGGAAVALGRRRFRAARALAIVQVATLLAGWGAAHAPTLLAPDVTIRSAAAPAATLAVLGPVLLVGAILVFPALFWLMRVFKARPP